MSGKDRCEALVVLYDLDDCVADPAGSGRLAACPERHADLPLHRAVVDLPHGPCIRLCAWTRDDLQARRELFLGMVGG